MGDSKAPRGRAAVRHTTVEEVRRLDLRGLRKRGIRGQPGEPMPVRWPGAGGCEYRGGLLFEGEQATFVWEHPAPDAPRPARQVIGLERTPCRLGGERVWFRCPCGRRVAVLYDLRRRFRCRYCADLRYGSQQEDYAARMRRKARRIRRRLGATMDLRVPVWERPKGMHEATFQRLRVAEIAANEAAVLGLAGWLGMDVGAD